MQVSLAECPGAGLGLVANTALLRGDVAIEVSTQQALLQLKPLAGSLCVCLLQLPASLLLTAERCSELCHFTPYMREQGLLTQSIVACFMLEVKACLAAGRSHPWGPWVAALPECSEGALHWTQEEVSSGKLAHLLCSD